MKTKLPVLALAALTAFALGAATGPQARRHGEPRRFSVKADRIAVDNVTKAAVLTGHVDAVSEPLHLRTELATRDAAGVMRLHEPTTMTTCTNHPGICHWRLRGDVEYLDGKYIKGRNVWVDFYELPVFWLPYFYYPLEGDCAFRVMPGYVSRWGAYLLTKTVYEIAGDQYHRDNAWWMHGNTRFDLRYENGIALGQTLYWNLGDFGGGKFKVYYAWDEDCDRYDHVPLLGHGYRKWGSLVDRDRYAFELSYRWEATERDTLRLKGSVFSDVYFRTDFFREGAFSIKNEWMGYEGNEVAWEHVEDMFGLGMSVSGTLNDFYGAAGRLPEIYFDVQPRPLFSLPVNYESENRLGYLSRQAGEYGKGFFRAPYAYNPGRWADYEAFRFDTYHRLTAPFRVADDLLSVVPRVGYHGTGWSGTGKTDLYGWDRAASGAAAFRSILESGATLAARGQADLDNGWRHMIEPYLDVLAQKSWTAGLNGEDRPYLFDSIDGSRAWEDQFAGRSRNLPYSYYGITPGYRNAISGADERGTFRTFFDFDVYAAMQFNETDYWGDNDYHKLARLDRPNYGRNAPYVMPGIRTRWNPDDDISLMTRFEYDADNNKLASGDIAWRQTVTKNFNYFLRYSIRDSRWWDYSSTPYDPSVMRNDDFNLAHFHNIYVGFTQQPIDWFAWSPYVRWDLKEGELDSVGAWFDYLTDCLGFRLLVAYENEYTCMDGSTRDAEWDIGFFIYLRALGPDATNFFD